MHHFVLVLVFAASLAQADAPRFDHWLLALTLAPAFCEDAPAAKKKLRQCRTLVTRAAPTLSLHGLWPNAQRRPHPEFCDGKPRERFCELERVALPQGLRRQLAYRMPGEADCLDRHQWVKHGACSGLDPAAYFGASIRLAARVEAALGDTLARYQGREIQLAVLLAALRQRDPALAAATIFDCRTPRTADPAKRRATLTEVRVRFARARTGEPGQPLPLANPVQQNSGCPGGRAWIDAPEG